jgi:hypothetical protein
MASTVTSVLTEQPELLAAMRLVAKRRTDTCQSIAGVRSSRTEMAERYAKIYFASSSVMMIGR